MNHNIIESNPIMSRLSLIKSGRSSFVSTPSKPKETTLITNTSEVKDSNLNSTPIIYKPPIRSLSSRPIKNAKSTNTYNTVISGTSAVSSTNVSNTNTISTNNTLVNKSSNKIVASGKQSEFIDEVEYDHNNINYIDNRKHFKNNNNPNKKINFTKCKNDINQIINNTKINLSTASSKNHSGNIDQTAYNSQYFKNNTNNTNKSDTQSLSHSNSSNNIVNFHKRNYSSYMTSNANTNEESFNNNYSSVTHRSQNHCVINFEDLMLLEEKLDDIITSINVKKSAMNECFEWWNFYFNCSVGGKLESYFKEEIHKNIIRDYTYIEMLSIIISYDSSYDKSLFEKIQQILINIMKLLHQNYLITCNYFISKVSSESQENLWVSKLRMLIENKLSIYKNNLDYKNYKNFSFISDIKTNNSCIYDYLRIILKNYSTDKSGVTETLISYFKNLNKLTVSLLNEFFRTKVLRVTNKKGSVLASVLSNSNEDLGQVAIPYLKKECLKPYTLVLDLDETLIHFKIDNQDESKGLLRLRPGIYEFLDCVSKYFELIIFTAATQDVKKYLFLVCRSNFRCNRAKQNLL